MNQDPSLVTLHLAADQTTQQGAEVHSQIQTLFYVERVHDTIQTFSTRSVVCDKIRAADGVRACSVDLDELGYREVSFIVEMLKYSRHRDYEPAPNLVVGRQ
jgi:hypothetical protein